MDEDFIQYGERIRSPWEAKFWSLYYRLETISSYYTTLRFSWHNGKQVNATALYHFYASADDFYSRAKIDIDKMMKKEDSKRLAGLFSLKKDATNAKTIMDLLNDFANKSGLSGSSEKFFKQPFDKIRASLGVKDVDSNDD